MRNPNNNNEEGGVVIEFVFATFLVFCIFVAYTQTAMLFASHERQAFAAFTAARANGIEGAGNPAALAGAIDSNFGITSSSGGVKLEKNMSMFLDFGGIFSNAGNNRFQLTKEFKTFKEPKLSGDNCDENR